MGEYTQEKSKKIKSISKDHTKLGQTVNKLLELEKLDQENLRTLVKSILNKNRDAESDEIFEAIIAT